MSNLTISPDNSVTIEQILTNPLAEPIYVNNATVNVDIKDNAGVSIADMPSTLFYVAGSNGVYRQTFDSLAVVANKYYTVVITASTPEPLYFKSELRVKAVKRGC